MLIVSRLGRLLDSKGPTRTANRGDYLGVDVNIAARVADAAKADQVMVSEGLLERLDSDQITAGKRRRLRADGAPRGMHVVPISRATAPS